MADGLFYPVDYVIDTWYQNDRHGTYPAPGGYDNQDPLLMADWRKMNLLYGRIYAQVLRERDAREVLDAFMTQARPTDVQTLFHD